MEDQSYHNALTTGVSDETHSGNRGLQENYRRKADVQREANKLGENLAGGVAALFLHPVFCFFGFWIIGFGSLLAFAPKFGMADAPIWYSWAAAIVPIAVAVMLRKIIPKLMAAAFFIGIAFLVVMMVFKVAEIREERAARAAAPPAVVAPATRTAAPKSPTAVDIQRALIDAAKPETTSIPPSEGPVGEIANTYCKELPELCE
ncbi:MAG: hypothetical protein WBN32_10305 [Woeseia sp.]